MIAGDAQSGPVRLRLYSGTVEAIFSVGHFAIFPDETRPTTAWGKAQHVLGPDPSAASHAFPNKFKFPWWARTSLRSERQFPDDIDRQVDAWAEMN